MALFDAPQEQPTSLDSISIISKNNKEPAEFNTGGFLKQKKLHNFI
jgi:uncharacterized beta-barrel protein YwiB (DUF1934 family)